jgi:deoxyribodipyrimidine photo-lyase
MTTLRRALVWLRNDLRLDDNPALNHAADNYDEVHVVYVWSPAEEGAWAPGAASRWWLHHSLENLGREIRDRGGFLEILESSDTLASLKKLVTERGIRGLFWNRRYEDFSRARDERIKSYFQAEGLETRSFNSQLLWEPWEVFTNDSKPYQVFTPFWKKVLSLDAPPKPRALSRKLHWAPQAAGARGDVAALDLLPRIPWAQAFPEHFAPGEEGARRALRSFLSGAVDEYRDARDRPSVRGTSRLSPHLHFGEISVRRVWHEVTELEEKSPSKSARVHRETYLKEIGWREFANHLLFHFPRTPSEPLRENFRHFPWRRSPKDFRIWSKGLTGYPIVDAGMRELWATGYMHNRVRMIVASYLVKDLRLSWFEGARWFWDTLVDADLASNTLGWQWAGGCGADAAPYFRVFNPVLQGEKFDPEGAYVKRWVPELARLPSAWVHKPWEAPQKIFDAAGLKLGREYPSPQVDHKQARLEALKAFEAIKTST